MMRMSRRAAPIAALLITMSPAVFRSGVVAQNPPRTLDIGGPPGENLVKDCSTDSTITAALAGFNSPAAVKVFSGLVSIAAGTTVNATYGVYSGLLRIDGTVQGSVIVLNGDARIGATGSVTGNITVLGGHLTVDPGARIGGRRETCTQSVPLMQLPGGTIAIRPRGRSLRNIASGVGTYVGAFRITPHLGVGQYNRIEALSPQAGGYAAFEATPQDSVRFGGYAIFRTARDPSGSRPTVGWHTDATLRHRGALDFSIGGEIGSTVQSTVDRPFGAVESGLSAFLFRRDYRDWYLRRGGSVLGSLYLNHELTLSGALEFSRQTTVLAVNALSLFRGNEPWRPNPLIDDGRYQTLSARITWDGRNEVDHPVLSWYGRAEVRHVTSNDLTPVSLPVTIRDAMPTSGYGELEGDLDVRAYLRLDQKQRLRFRILAGGYLGGDPMTIQRRRAIGGGDPLSGFVFRAINCDRRRKPDPAQPPLCDREMAIQAEYHRALPLDFNARIGSYTFGIHRPDLVLLSDAGSAWLAGNTAGRVPTDRIQTLREWRSDVGVGLSTGGLGVYVAKSLVDGTSPRLLFLFHPRL
jgi:hypothetical protein